RGGGRNRGRREREKGRRTRKRIRKASTNQDEPNCAATTRLLNSETAGGGLVKTIKKFTDCPAGTLNCLGGTRFCRMPISRIVRLSSAVAAVSVPQKITRCPASLPPTSYTAPSTWMLRPGNRT